MAGRTTIMIAHRLSTLDVCDARLSLEHGRIAEALGNIDCAALAGAPASGRKHAPSA
jgi:ABC-type bacteriocin/lantibiotic exporter with double-glycine peptidase domain